MKKIEREKFEKKRLKKGNLYFVIVNVGMN